jgi:hypothetical protein
MHEVQVKIRLSPADRSVLARFIAEMDAAMHSDPRAAGMDGWSEEEAIIAIFDIGMNRFRTTLAAHTPALVPDWLQHLVQAAMAEIPR